MQQQEEEATEGEALPRARKLAAGDNKDKKVELGSSARARSLGRRAADGAIANDAITNFARRPGERGEGAEKEERARQRATVVECE